MMSLTFDIKSTTKSNPQHTKESSNTQPFFSPATIQPKLTIGQPNDKYEQEADTMADKVMRMPENKTAVGGADANEENDGLAIQTKCHDCEEKEQVQRAEMETDSEADEGIQLKPLMLKSENGGGVATDALSSQLNRTKGGGSPLPEYTNQFMSNAFHTDFSKVRVHTDSNAVQMNRGLNARAFTHGSDVYFNDGEYSPNSLQGKQLLAHELMHVVQQNGSKIQSNKVQKKPINYHQFYRTRTKIIQKESNSTVEKYKSIHPILEHDEVRRRTELFLYIDHQPKTNAILEEDTKVDIYEKHTNDYYVIAKIKLRTGIEERLGFVKKQNLKKWYKEHGQLKKTKTELEKYKANNKVLYQARVKKDTNLIEAGANKGKVTADTIVSVYKDNPEKTMVEVIAKVVHIGEQTGYLDRGILEKKLEEKIEAEAPVDSKGTSTKRYERLKEIYYSPEKIISSPLAPPGDIKWIGDRALFLMRGFNETEQSVFLLEFNKKESFLSKLIKFTNKQRVFHSLASWKLSLDEKLSLVFEIDDGTWVDYKDIRETIVFSVQNGFSPETWKEFFINVCTNETIHQAVIDLKLDAATAKAWIEEEGGENTNSPQKSEFDDLLENAEKVPALTKKFKAFSLKVGDSKLKQAVVALTDYKKAFEKYKSTDEWLAGDLISPGMEVYSRKKNPAYEIAKKAAYAKNDILIEKLKVLDSTLAKTGYEFFGDYSEAAAAFETYLEQFEDEFYPQFERQALVIAHSILDRSEKGLYQNDVYSDEDILAIRSGFKEARAGYKKPYNDEEKTKKLLQKYPILNDDELDIHTVLNGSLEEARFKLELRAYRIHANIKKSRELLRDPDEDKIWELPGVIKATKERMFIKNPVMEYLIGKKADEASELSFWEVFLTVTQIALALAALYLPGGTSGVVLLALSIGTGIADVKIQYDKYAEGEALSDSDFSKARSLSQDDPSVIWLAISIAGLVLDVADIIKIMGGVKAAIPKGLKSADDIPKIRQAIEEATEGLPKKDEIVEKVTQAAAKEADRIKGILSSVKTKIADAGDEFALKYTDDELIEIFAKGKQLGLGDELIEDLVLVGARKKKPIGFEDLLVQMDNYAKIIKPRGYPYLFKSLEAFESFKSELISYLKKHTIPIDDIRVQGSSLRTKAAKDIDIAVFVSKSDLTRLTETMESGIIARAQPRNHRKLLEQLKRGKKLGRINSYLFDHLPGTGKTPNQELREIIAKFIPSGKGIDLSIMLVGRNFDVSPYLKF